MTQPINAYISGPMSGLPYDNFPAFNRMEGLLDAVGVNPLNPARLPKGLSYAVYMQLDLVLVAASQVVILLPGYDQSKGANTEHKYALSLNIPCIFWDPNWGTNSLLESIESVLTSRAAA